MNSAMPPLYLNSACFASPVFESVMRSSVSVMTQPLVQEGQLAQTLRQRVVVVFGDRENFFVGNEMNLGPALLGRARLLQLAGWLAFE